MTDAEREAYIQRRFCVDEVTGEIIGERLTPCQQARLAGVDWFDHSGLPEWDEGIAVEIRPELLKGHGNDKALER